MKREHCISCHKPLGIFNQKIKIAFNDYVCKECYLKAGYKLNLKKELQYAITALDIKNKNGLSTEQKIELYDGLKAIEKGEFPFANIPNQTANTSKQSIINYLPYFIYNPNNSMIEINPNSKYNYKFNIHSIINFELYYDLDTQQQFSVTNGVIGSIAMNGPQGIIMGLAFPEERKYVTQIILRLETTETNKPYKDIIFLDSLMYTDTKEYQQLANDVDKVINFLSQNI